jgi:hypothetical protein
MDKVVHLSDIFNTIFYFNFFRAQKSTFLIDQSLK